MVKNLLAMQETWVWSLGQEDPLEKGMATHSSFLPGKSYDRGAWWVNVHGVAKSRTRLSHKHTHILAAITSLFPLGQWVSNCAVFRITWRACLCSDCWALPPELLIPIGLGHSMKMYSPNKFPGESDATTPWKLQPWTKPLPPMPCLGPIPQFLP